MMNASKQLATSCAEIRSFLSNSYLSKEEFSKRYKKLIESKVNPKHLYLRIISELEEAILKGNLASFKRFGKLIDYFGGVETTATLKSYYNDTDNTFKTLNLAILACKHDRIEILRYIFSNTKVFENLFIDEIAPGDKDESTHDAFYYAVRSQNVDLLDTLINNWPGDYFTSRFAELDEILSRNYEELKLKNVALSDEMKIFVESKLINLRFFSNPSGQVRNAKNHLSNIIERVNLLLGKITTLKNEYSSNGNKIDATFLFIGRFIAQNIHVLKRQLRVTYDRLPWEEIEFCLVAFLSSYSKPREINLFYRSVLNKNKILSYLHNFAKKLAGELQFIKRLEVSKLAELPYLHRDKVASKIVRDCPQFVDLYSDYQQIRDICSLERISAYLNLALSADPEQREGQLIITRALQVIGEYLKNTIESPNLSNATSELLLLSLPKHTRLVITDLRNSLSHANSLMKRAEIDDNTDVGFFKGVQNDSKRIDDVVTNILYKNKVKTIEAIRNILTSDESLDEKKAIAEVLTNTEVHFTTSNRFSMSELDQLEKLVKQLNDILTKKTSEEKNWFDEINTIINSAKTNSENIKFDYNMAFTSLQTMCKSYTDPGHHQTTVEGMKSMKITTDMAFNSFIPQIESCNFKKIIELSRKISFSAEIKIQDQEIIDKVKMLAYEIFHIAQFSVNDIKWIEKLRGRLSEKSAYVQVSKQNETYKLTADECDKQLAQKLNELKNIFNKNPICNVLEKLPSYKKDNKLLAAVEMLVLDIMSLLSRSDKHLENNLLFVDDNSPLLMGKCLRNHLAHDNTLLDLLLSDPSAAVILNAGKLVSENIVKSKKKVGKLVPDNPAKVNQKYDHDLAVITIQENMFEALMNEDLEELKSCLLKGADIHGRTIKSSTTLHLAAQGSNLELVKFVIDQNIPDNVRDSNGQTPLHVAASHGRKNIVKFFLSRSSIFVDDTDKHNRTPLHWAAKNGHKDVVELLLQKNASTDVKDEAINAPVHYAIGNKHVSAAKILLSRELDVDKNESASGFTSLQLATRSGCLELVEFLLEKGASVYKKNDNFGTALHPPAYNGYLEIVELLIRKGSDVNARLIDGSTPLHYALENGHEKVAELLLKHRANVNYACRTYKATPLHQAALDGYESIVELLLKNKADADFRCIGDVTPLYLAVQNGHLKVVEILLKHGVNINASNYRCRTALHCAVEHGRNEIAELLIQYGANVNAKDDNYCTPFHIAANTGNESLVQALIKNKANVFDRNFVGCTAIFAAAGGGHKGVIEILLKNKLQVNSKSYDGATPLHFAALSGHYDVCVFLLEQKADLNAKDNIGRTPLYAAILKNQLQIVNLLVENGANVRLNSNNDSPLHAAAAGGHTEIVEILLKKGVDVNFRVNDRPPLMTAVHADNKDIVEVLLKYGADINVEDGEPLVVSVVSGFQEMVELLLRKNARVDIKRTQDLTALHHAATRGHVEIANILLSYGANVNAECTNTMTPLECAAQAGHSEMVEFLITKGARVKFQGNLCIPLVPAIDNGHVHVVDVLLRNISQRSRNDVDFKAFLDLTVMCGHLPIVKKLMRYGNIDVNSKGKDDYTLLLSAAHQNNLEMVKYFVNNGANIRAKTSIGLQSIHIAARENFKDAVEYFLSIGIDINEPDDTAKGPLHYAVMKNHQDLAKYLIAKGANVNAKDTSDGFSPMHLAAIFGFKHIVQILLENGAVYNALDNYSRKPADVARNEEVLVVDENDVPINKKPVFDLLSSIDNLFDAIKRNSPPDVEKFIKAGAFVNAKNVETETTPLHYAAWKGCQQVVDILLKNNANTNAICSKGFTALHYAAKYGHLECVKILLSHGAIYNASSETRKMPLDVTKDKSIVKLFKTIEDLFKKVTSNDVRVLLTLSNVSEGDLKVIMNARNRENRSLIAAASKNNDKVLVEGLKSVCQDNVLSQIIEAQNLIVRGNHQLALSNLRRILEKRKQLFGADNPATLDIETWIAKALFKQGNYQAALDLYEQVYHKQKEVFGSDDKVTLETRSGMALVMWTLGKIEESLKIYRETYEKQKEVLGPDHENTLETEFHMAAPLKSLGKHEEALKIYEATFERAKSTKGSMHISTISAQNNIAGVLVEFGKNEEALRTFQEVFEKKKIVLGSDHADTLRSMHNIASAYEILKRYQDAIKILEEVSSIQKRVFPPNHPDYFKTKCSIASILMLQNKVNAAWKLYKECHDQAVASYGPNHSVTLGISQLIEAIKLQFRFDGTDESQRALYMQTDVNIAVSKGDIPTITRLLKQGADVNETDVEGRAPIHFAVENGLLNVINLLLENSADVTQATNKGNTPLHTAAIKNYSEVAQVLLDHVDRNKLHDFVNAKTSSGGMTALHVAAKKGYSKVAKVLLKNNATYDVLNKENKTPLDLASDQKIIELFKKIEEIFKLTKEGSVLVVNKLKALKPDEFSVVTNARSRQGHGLLQVAIVYKHTNIVSALLAMLKKST